MDLHGKVILITGAKGGLGTFVTNSFLEAGARVFGVSRSIADSDFPHPNFSAVAAELSDGDRARQVAESVVEQSRPHRWTGAPGGSVRRRAVRRRDGRCDARQDARSQSAIGVSRDPSRSCRSCARKGSGRIVAIGSKAAVEPAALAGVYAASKAALVSLIRTVARENADRACVRQHRAAGHDGHARQSRRRSKCGLLEMGSSLPGGEASGSSGLRSSFSGQRRRDPDLRR